DGGVEHPSRGGERPQPRRLGAALPAGRRPGGLAETGRHQCPRSPAAMTERSALIFDFGNVVAHFDFTRSCERLGRPLGLDGAEVLAMARAAGFVDVLKTYESGRMTSEEFHRRVAA